MITIDLPYPSKINGHNNGHWRAKSETIRKMRDTARLACLDQINRGAVPIKGLHKISYRFFVRDKRRRDRANMVQQCKPYIDGIVDAGLIDGDHWQVSEIGSVEVYVDSAFPRVVITIEVTE